MSNPHPPTHLTTATIDAHTHQAGQVSERAVARLRDFNRRTLDVIASRIYFYFGWVPWQLRWAPVWVVGGLGCP